MALAPMRHDGRNELLQARGNAWHLYAFVGVFSFAVNLLMGLTPISARTFYWISQAGMLAGTAVCSIVELHDPIWDWTS